MSIGRSHIVLIAGLALAGCAGGNQARNPIWVSKSINGLQQSACNCGGVETKKQFKARRKAEAEAQLARTSEDGRN